MQPILIHVHGRPGHLMLLIDMKRLGLPGILSL